MRYCPLGADDMHRTSCGDDMPSLREPPKLALLASGNPCCGLDKKEVTFGRQKLLLFWRKGRDRIKNNGFAETCFGAHGRFCSFDFEQLQHNALKTLHRRVFTRRTDMGTGFRIPFYPFRNKKGHPMDVLFYGGKGGIRTLERVLAVTRFPVVRLRPAQPPFRSLLLTVNRDPQIAQLLYHMKNEKSILFLFFFK